MFIVKRAKPNQAPEERHERANIDKNLERPRPNLHKERRTVLIRVIRVN